MKKSIISVLLSILTFILFATNVYAASVENVEINLPEVKAEVFADDVALDVNKISATLDGKELKMTNSDIQSQSVEWIIFVDTSKSISNAHFVAQKKAIASIYNSLGKDDKFQLYTFDEKINKVLEKGVSKEEAEKKINAIVCNGQDTQFYDVLGKMIDLSKNSKADIVKPVIYTDGVDTISKTSKENIVKKLETSSVPVYGFYASALNEDKAKSFNELLKKSGGEAKSFTVKNAADTLSNTKSGVVALAFNFDGEIKANENTDFVIDLGDGKKLENKVAVKSDYPVVTTKAEAETSAEDKTEKNNENNEEKGFNILFVIIPVIIILVAALILLLLKKKKDNKVTESKAEDNIEQSSGDEAAESNDENAEVVAEPKKKKKKKDDEPDVQFYFVNKK